VEYGGFVGRRRGEEKVDVVGKSGEVVRALMTSLALARRLRGSLHSAAYAHSLPRED
jgi:hypothetical protein